MFTLSRWIWKGWISVKNVCVNFMPCYCWFCMHTFALIHISLFVCACILNISIGSTLHRVLAEIIRVQIMLRTDFVWNGQQWNWAVCYGREESIRCKNFRGHIRVYGLVKTLNKSTASCSALWTINRTLFNLDMFKIYFNAHLDSEWDKIFRGGCYVIAMFKLSSLNIYVRLFVCLVWCVAVFQNWVGYITMVRLIISVYRNASIYSNKIITYSVCLWGRRIKLALNPKKIDTKGFSMDSGTIRHA